jgi:hypothetical protein
MLRQIAVRLEEPAMKSDTEVGGWRNDRRSADQVEPALQHTLIARTRWTSRDVLLVTQRVERQELTVDLFARAFDALGAGHECHS